VITGLSSTRLVLSALVAQPQTAATFDSLFNWYLFFGIGAAVVVIGLMIAFSIKYRSRGASGPVKHKAESWKIALVTVVISLSILTAAEYQTFASFGNIEIPDPPGAVTIHVLAFQWGWNFAYPGHVAVRGVTTEDPDPVGLNGNACAPAVDCLGPGLVVPAGQTTRITLTSNDVIHGFYVPEFNFSRYAQPGVTNVFDLTVQHAGIYRAQCTQLCGLYHSLMFFHVVALPPAQFRAWLSTEEQVSTTAAISPSSTSTRGAA